MDIIFRTHARAKSLAGHWPDLVRAAGQAFGQAGAMFMPPVCVHCLRDRWRATPLCLNCLRRLAPLRPPVCGVCGMSGCEGSHGEEEPSLASKRFLFRMEPGISTLIHGFKYRHMRRHIRFLCAYLRYRPDLKEFARSFDALVPVPIHPARRRERGYNQAEEICAEFRDYLALPMLPSALRRTRATRSQTRLDRRQRGRNLDGAFACPDPDAVRGKRLILVDDVFTTGATMGRCADLLIAAGASNVAGLALARVEAEDAKDDFALEMEAVSTFAA